MTETRAAIRSYIRDNPGVHFNALGRALNIATGQVQYHLRQLEQEGHVRSQSVCGQTHYFPPTYSASERKAIALLRRETTRELVLLLLKRERDHPAHLADDLELARSTIEWHLSNLIDHGLVEKYEDSDGPVVTLTDRETTYRLLREIEPRFADRLVDRFTRLADDLLGE